MLEIEDDMDRETIYCLTETHKREKNGKKGSSLIMLWESELEMKSRELSTKFNTQQTLLQHQQTSQ